MIEVAGLTKAFGATRALEGVSFTVPEGTVLGLIGHNGAGKTSLINILSTLLPPTSGTARVAGYDVVRQGAQVRARIGLTGQFASIDETMSGRDNLILLARLLGAGRRAAASRVAYLLEIFRLSTVANRAARTYSGGMRRRLDLAASIVGRPQVIFLDEPTTGLDPEARHDAWDLVQQLVDDGTTVLLTTQYLEEADRLAKSIVVLAAGRVLASGTPAQLKAEVGERSVTVVLGDGAVGPAALAALERANLTGTYDRARRSVTVPIHDAAMVAEVVGCMNEAGARLDGLTVVEPTLDDVYLSLKGSAATGSE
ncbi:ATP-binding cassette domain-containing protein [Micromonospora tarensis]|uniref:ATP-binding cassette domain-containing protein n=1 Tax=Micromonospora tarensis TaxID=2806100 RepID=UPI0028155EFC|nr:ATP-binding cassette domain-containing protein [Micromonospora tarensis]